MKILRSHTLPRSMRLLNYGAIIVFLLVVCLDLLLAERAVAEWKMMVQSRTVPINQENVTVTFTYAWDDPILQTTLPIIVRRTVGWAFWTGSLPYDTTDSNGVTWNSTVESWSNIICEAGSPPRAVEIYLHRVGWVYVSCIMATYAT